MFFDPEGDNGDYELRVLQRIAPEDPKQVASFLELGGSSQLAGLEQGLPPVAPGEFASFAAGLDGEPARVMAVKAACRAATKDGVDPAVSAAWAGVITTSLEASSSSWGLDFVGQTRGFADCDALVMPELLFSSEYKKLQTDAGVSGKGDARLAYLAQFTISPELALSTWGNVARTSSSLRARKLALRYLKRYVAPDSGLDPAMLPAFRALFLDVLQHSEVAMVLGQDIGGVVSTAAPTATENAAALERMHQVLENPLTRTVHLAAACAAIRLTRKDSSVYREFVETLNQANLSAATRVLLLDPAECR